jgi:hypothetical protein
VSGDHPEDVARPDPLLDHAGQEAWVRTQLDDLGLRPAGPSERVHVRPWATAVRVPTSDGVVWFKAHTPLLTHEAPLTRVLARLRPDAVLEVLASDDERCWLLTADAGDKLRTRIETADDLPLLEPVLATYADLQRAAAAEVGAMVAAGAPDRRGERVGALLLAALDDDAASGAAGQADPLTADERQRLARHVPRLSALARDASAVTGDSVDHCDLHDGNVFASSATVRIGDFGDACVGHPFVSLVVLGRSLTNRLGVEPDGPQMRRLRDAYLEPWAGRVARPELLGLVEGVRPLGLLGRGLTWRALVTGIDDPAMAEFADGWSAYARELLESLDNLQPTRGDA